jgi:hypothetical protein
MASLQNDYFVDEHLLGINLKFDEQSDFWSKILFTFFKIYIKLYKNKTLKFFKFGLKSKIWRQKVGNKRDVNKRLTGKAWRNLG